MEIRMDQTVWEACQAAGFTDRELGELTDVAQGQETAEEEAAEAGGSRIAPLRDLLLLANRLEGEAARRRAAVPPDETASGKAAGMILPDEAWEAAMCCGLTDQALGRVCSAALDRVLEGAELPDLGGRSQLLAALLVQVGELSAEIAHAAPGCCQENHKDSPQPEGKLHCFRFTPDVWRALKAARHTDREMGLLMKAVMRATFEDAALDPALGKRVLPFAILLCGINRNEAWRAAAMAAAVSDPAAESTGGEALAAEDVREEAQPAEAAADAADGETPGRVPALSVAGKVRRESVTIPAAAEAAMRMAGLTLRERGRTRRAVYAGVFDGAAPDSSLGATSQSLAELILLLIGTEEPLLADCAA